MDIDMFYIPVMVVFLLGLGATLKYGYKVYSGKVKDIGSFLSFGYLTIIYGLYSFPNFFDDAAPFIRIGIAIVFLVKILTFGYELFLEILKKRAWKKCALLKGGD